MTRIAISAMTLAVAAACSGATERGALDAPVVELVEELRLDPNAEGDTIVSRAYPYRGIPVPPHVRDSVLDAFIPPEGRPREGPADLPQRFQSIAREKMPPIYPPVMAP